MPLSTDITLPKSQEPVFPDMCVVCGKDAPGHTVKIGTNAIGWWTWLLWTFGPRYSVRAPACKKCGIKLQFHRWAGLLITIVLIVVIIWVLHPYVKQWAPHSLRKWVMGAGVIICLIPWFVWQAFFPPPFEITAHSDRVDYEFRDPLYALKFLVRNKYREDETDESPEDE